MGLKVIIKIGTFISVLLFCVAVGYYAFIQLNTADRNREVNLISYVPVDCVGVLETDNINAFLDMFPTLSYSRELDGSHFSGLFSLVLGGLNGYAYENAHGLTNQMNHLVVSFHQPYTPRNQVVYFRMNREGEQVLVDMLAEYASSLYLPKEEIYRNKSIRIYPLGDDDFLSFYSEDGLVVLSYQKRLIEKVIDARLDKKSLNDDDSFSGISERRKSKDFFTLYTKSAPIPFLQMEQSCWSEYDFHLNSDVLYLTGDIYVPDWSDCKGRISQVPFVKEDKFLLSSEKDSTLYYMGRAGDNTETEKPDLFDECVANLSQEAVLSMVVDMEEVVRDPQRYRECLPSFVWNNNRLFQSFILSVQLSKNNGGFSHMWVFTYKY